MLQVNVLRNNPQFVKERLAIKNFKQLELVDEIIALDDERKKLQAESDALQSKIKWLPCQAFSQSVQQVLLQGSTIVAANQNLQT